MIRSALIVGFLMLSASAPALAQGVDLRDAGRFSSGIPGVDSSKEEPPGRSKTNACDCCRKCKNARRPAAPKEKEGPTLTDGCKECCDRCGADQPPSPEEIPSEIMERRLPPDIKGKPTR